jgi:16S rRNA (uracil1498-N3)-methyltransferase
MNKPRLIIPGLKLSPGEVSVGPEFARHARVLRLAPGDEIVLCDGAGHEMRGQVVSLSAELLLVDLREVLALTSEEAPLQITLYQGIAKGEKMEWIIQKATELGVTRIIPVAMARSVAKYDKPPSRWEKIAQEAARQSERTHIPEIAPIVSVKGAVASIKSAVKTERHTNETHEQSELAKQRAHLSKTQERASRESTEHAQLNSEYEQSEPAKRAQLRSEYERSESTESAQLRSGYERSESAEQRAHMRVLNESGASHESAEQRAHMRVLLDETGQGERLREVLRGMPGAREVSFWVGPEGGTTPEERALMISAGFTPAYLGKRILRTETASIAMIAILQHYYGDLG